MSKAIATTGFMHSKNYRKGDTVDEAPEVIADLEKAGLVTTDEGGAKKAPEPDNKKRVEPVNKAAK